jgi:DNA uptake protein ComE-like DNA-binding protein
MNLFEEVFATGRELLQALQASDVRSQFQHLLEENFDALVAGMLHASSYDAQRRVNLPHARSYQLQAVPGLGERRR